MVTLRRLAKWGLGSEPSAEAITHEVTIRRHKFRLKQIFHVIFSSSNLIFIYHYLSRMATLKENKGKEMMDEVVRQGESQPHPFVGEKRKSISKGVDLGNLPSRRREKKAKHKSSKPGGAQTTLPVLPV